VFYYERSGEAAAQFEARFRQTLRYISEFPRSAPLSGENRRFRIPGFPYSVITDRDSETVVAVAHDRRRPGYWLDDRR
jgi:plasmid stabilization system protein ParE